MIKNIIKLPRSSKQIILLLIDSFLLIGVLIVSFSLRLGNWFLPSGDLLILILVAPLLAIPIPFLSIALISWLVKPFVVKEKL